MELLPPPPGPVRRRFRRTRWSILRRVAPLTPVTIAYHGALRLSVRPADRLGKRVYLDGYSDREHAALLVARLRPGMTYFDVGANFGQFSVLAGHLVGPGGAVHAFEAGSVMAQQAAHNARINGLTQVTVNHAAVSDRPGTLTLRLCRPGQEGFNSVGQPMRGADAVVGVEEVEAVTLDGYAARHGVTQIDLLKIDVEGAEVAALRGAARLLQLTTAVACEVNPVTLAALGASVGELLQLLTGAGFTLHTFDADTARAAPFDAGAPVTQTVNVLALRGPGAGG